MGVQRQAWGRMQPLEALYSAIGLSPEAGGRERGRVQQRRKTHVLFAPSSPLALRSLLNRAILGRERCGRAIHGGWAATLGGYDAASPLAP